MQKRYRNKEKKWGKKKDADGAGIAELEEAALNTSRMCANVTLQIIIIIIITEKKKTDVKQYKDKNKDKNKKETTLI